MIILYIYKLFINRKLLIEIGQYYFYGSNGFIYIINSTFLGNNAYSEKGLGGGIDGWGVGGKYITLYRKL